MAMAVAVADRSHGQTKAAEQRERGPVAAARASLKDRLRGLKSAHISPQRTRPAANVNVPLVDQRKAQLRL